MEKQPFTGNGTFSTRGNNQDSTANGAASISLRGLGADATLVLVNGRRVAISAFAESITTNFVDINSIPVAAIERSKCSRTGLGGLRLGRRRGRRQHHPAQGLRGLRGFGRRAAGRPSRATTRRTSPAIWGMSGEDSNVTIIARLLQEQHAHEHGARELHRLRWTSHDAAAASTCAPRAASRAASSSRWLLEPTTRTRRRTAVVDPSCPPDRIAGADLRVRLRPVQPAHPGGRAHRPDAAGPPGIRRRRRVLHRDRRPAQQFPRPGRAHAARRRRGTDGADHASEQSVPGRDDIDDRPLTARSMPARAQWHIETDNLRGVLGLRGDYQRLELGSLGAACAQRDRAERRPVGWAGCARISCSNEINAGRYNPFGATVNPQT